MVVFWLGGPTAPLAPPLATAMTRLAVTQYTVESVLSWSSRSSIARFFSRTSQLTQYIYMCFSFLLWRADKPRKPTLTSDAVSNAVPINGSLNLKCNADANPSAQFELRRNGTLVKQAPDLSIGRVTWSDLGRYTCVASNILGKETSAPLVISAAREYLQNCALGYEVDCTWRSWNTSPQGIA